MLKKFSNEELYKIYIQRLCLTENSQIILIKNMGTIVIVNINNNSYAIEKDFLNNLIKNVKFK